MGLLSGVWSNFKKSEAAVVVQNLLALEAENGLFDGDAAAAARELVQNAWDRRPDLFEGKLGVRPDKLAIAATAFSDAVGKQAPSGDFDPVHLLCLGRILEAVDRKGAALRLSGLDFDLLDAAAETFRKAEEQLAAAPIGRDIDELLERCQTDWTVWIATYKAEAARFNPGLKVDENGFSIIDMMDDAPLRRAFHDRKDPVRLGRSFGKSFDISRMKG